MDSVLVMFDSFAIPQGREVMNYYMPLQYGFDGILELCDEKSQKPWVKLAVMAFWA
jgi:formate C-acetyltransferase